MYTHGISEKLNWLPVSNSVNLTTKIEITFRVKGRATYYQAVHRSLVLFDELKGQRNRFA
ncbi:MAG: hypothetical protein CXZ00_15050 [Acidobacteria bacterium]|nr:MAG: hypothetical protein CXZ00_15050 [Acidobacteriota bacterium]